MIRRPPRSTRTDTLFPYTTLFRSVGSLTSDKAHPAATLYRLDPDGSLTEILHGLTTSNGAAFSPDGATRSEEHTSELQSLMRISYAVFCLKKKKTTKHKQ